MIRSQFTLDLSAELVVDNFAGGGGASTGIELALGRHVDIAVNHDRDAVAMHEANHPQTRHLCEDVFAVDPVEVTGGRPVGLAWFSPDCKHFSKAKGGKPRSKKIRGLAWIVVKWAAKVRPRVIILENVEEFQTWGPLKKDGTPCARRKGKTFANWCARLRNLGYAIEWRELRACDHGAPTIRKRLFVIARCDGQPIVWPEPTHGDPKSDAVKRGRLKPWRTAAECIDWSIPCPSIFERARPLAPATCRRIAKGIMRYVVNCADPFIVGLAHGEHQNRAGSRATPCAEPVRTVHAGGNNFALVAPSIVPLTHQGDSRAHSVEEPARTVTGAQRGEMALVAAKVERVDGYDNDRDLWRQTCNCGHEYIARLVDPCPGCGKFDSGFTHSDPVGIAPVLTEHAQASNARVFDPAQPLRTQCAQVKGGHFALVEAFLTKFRKDNAGASLRDPAPTVTANSFIKRPGGAAPIGVVATHLTKLRGTSTAQPASDPLHTISAQGGHFAEVRAFLVKYYGNEKEAHQLTDPLGTVTTNDRFGLVTVRGVEYAITDIGMRMLSPRELFRAQGFPTDFIIGDDGRAGLTLTKTAQVRMCGNSVCPPLAAALVRANVPELAAWHNGERKEASA